MERITARENQNIKRVVRLCASRRARCESGQFVAEGVKLCREAHLAGCDVDELYMTAEVCEKHGEKLAPLIKDAGAVYEITDDIAHKISDTVTPQGIFAVCRAMEEALDESTLPSGRYIALESLQNPGNLGTILRSADAFGVDGVILTEDCPDIFSPKVLRSTMGSAFRVKTCRTKNLAALLRKLSQTHVTYAAALSEGAVSLSRCCLEGDIVVAVGNEGGGLSRGVIDACEACVIIEMRGGAESLNAAVAASVILWEMSK